MLNFSEVIDLTTNEHNTAPKSIRNTLLISCEADSTVSQFFIDDNNRTNAKNGMLDALNSLYNVIDWSESFAPITTQRVASLGVKNFPGVGSIAFYNLLDEERSGILSPVFVEGKRFTRPTLKDIVIVDGTMQVLFESPPEMTYDAYRLILRNGNVAFEYITYEEYAEFPTPYITGSYECYCVGYKNEGEAVSLNSNVLTIDITEDNASEDPSLKHDIYVKATTLTSDGYLKLILSNDAEVLLQVGLATRQNLADSIRSSIQDTWEARY